MVLPLPEPMPQLDELLGSLSSNLTAEIQEHLEGGVAIPVEELKAERVLAFKMAGLLDGKDCPDLLPTDVHVQGVRLDIEENARRAESTELADSLQGGAAVRDDDVDLAERLKSSESVLPSEQDRVQRLDFQGKPG